MADQNRNQSNQNASRGRQGEPTDRSRDDEAIDSVSTRGRSNREPASMADDRGLGESRRNVRTDDVDALEDDTRIESDLDDTSDVDEGGSER